MSKQVFQSTDHNGQVLTELEAVQLLSDATSSDHATRLSQVQQVSADSVQAALVGSTEQASSDTAFTSSTMQAFLAGKQDNMEIDAGSASYLEIVDGYKINVKQLLITDVKVDEVHGTLSAYLAAHSTQDKQEGDVVILNAAIDNQERSWIKTGAVSQGADGYTRLQTDYNVTSIRAMLSEGSFMSYSAASGQFSVDLGTVASKLGGQTLPHGASFTTIAPDADTASALEKIEELINAVESNGADGTTAVTSRINNLMGVSGANLGAFSGRLPDNSNTKTVLAAVEADLSSRQTDNMLLRQDMITGDASLQTNLDAANASRIAGDLASDAASVARDNTLQSNVDTVDAALTSEAATRLSADNALDARLDTVEGTSTTTGSIAKAQLDAQAFATASVSSEAASRSAADVVLQNQINAISDAFQYKGNIRADGTIEHIDVTDANHNKVFGNASFEKGDMYKVNGDLSLSLSGSTSIDVNVGDSLVVLTPCPAGTCTSDDFHKWDNTEAADILREGMLDGVTVEKVGGIVKVIDDSVGRTQLAADVETDIDSKVEKAGDTMTGALEINKVVTSGSGHTGGYDFSAHLKMKSVDTASLDDTQRALLVENEVYTNGSGNPMDLDYANAATISSHYKGASQDMSVAVSGVNGEGRVLNPAAAIYATGAYGIATDSQLGINAGGTFIAQNAATANMGVFSFSDTAGALHNRAAYFALAPDSLDFDGYRVARVMNPLAVSDAAVVIDDYSGTKHALYVSGKSEFVGKVIVPSSTADNEAINGADIKAKEKIYSFDLVDGVSKVISTPSSMDLDKVIWQVVDNNTEVGLSVTLDNASHTVTVLAAGGNLTGVTLLLKELSCDVESV